MSKTLQFGRFGNIPKQPAQWRKHFGWWVLAIVVLGIIAASPIGMTIGILAAFTVIGIPILFLMMLYPNVSMVAGLTWVVWKLLKRVGPDSILLSGAIAIGLLFAYPVLHNWMVMAKVNQYLKDEVQTLPDGVAPTFNGGALAVLQGRGGGTDCTTFCQQVLLSGKAETFIAARMRKNSMDMQFDGFARSYRLEQRDFCTDVERNENTKQLKFYQKAEQVSNAMKQRLDNGHCLVVEKTEVTTADAILFVPRYESQGKGYSNTNPFDQYVRAERVAYYQKDETGNFQRAFQETALDYKLLGPVVFFYWSGSGTMQIDPDLWRTRHRTHDRLWKANDKIGFMKEKVGVDFSLMN